MLAGFAVWALVAPQAIAYADIAGLPPEVGLYTTFAGLLGYALLGTSRQLVVSPTSSTAIISAALIAPLALGDADEFAELSAALAILTGLVFVILGLFKMGFVSQFIAAAVQVGVMFGLGLTIIVGQMGKMLGVPVEDGTFFEQLRDVVGELSNTQGWTLAVGLSSLAALFVLQRLLPGLPAALIVVVAAVIASYALDLSDRGVAVVSEVSQSVPLPAIPTFSFDQFISLLPGVLAIAVIGYAESDTVAEQFASEHRYRIKPNQELFALSAANGLAGLFQGFITGGGASQSAANDRAGAKTQLATLIVSALTLLTIVALVPLFQELPSAVLGAIVIGAVVGFLRVREVQRIRQLRRDSFMLALVALFGVLLLGIMPGLLIAITLSVLLLLSRVSRPGDSVLGRLAGSTAFVDVTRHSDVEQVSGLLIYRLDAPLLFINANTMRDRLQQLIQEADPLPTVVVADLAFSDELDIKGADTLRELRHTLGEEGIELWLADVRGPAIDMLRSSSTKSEFDESPIFHTVDEAVQAFRAQQPSRATGIP